MGWIDFVILILVGLNIWTGYHGGTVRAVISVVGMIAGIEFASRNFQRFARELAPMVHSLEAANAIWFILQVFIVLLAFNFIGHAFQHEVGQMLHHDSGEDDPEKEKPKRRKTDAPVVGDSNHRTSAHSAQHEIHEQHSHPLLHEHHQIHETHGQLGHFKPHGHIEHHLHHEAQAHHQPNAHSKVNAHRTKVMNHEVVSSLTEGAWTKVSATDGVIGGLLG